MLTDKKILPSYNIFISKDLSKEAFIHYTDHLGKRHRKKGGINRFHTFDERHAAALALVAKLQAEYEPPSLMADKMRDWVEEKRPGWKPKSYQTFKSKVDVFLEWANGREITPGLVSEFFKYLLSSKHKRTYQAYFEFLRRLFRAIDEPELISLVEPVKWVSTPAKYFQSHQIARIKGHLLETDPSLWLVFQLIYYCFIRPGELRQLKIGDIHFDEWKICVRSDISKNKKQEYVTVPVAFRPSVDALKHRSPNEYVFFKDDCTKPTSRDYFSKRFRKVLKALGFGLEYKLYSAKHSGAVALGREKVNVEQIRKQLRHHSLDETQGYLRQLGVEDLEDLAASFPAI